MADFEKFLNVMHPDATEKERELMRFTINASQLERCKHTRASIVLQIDRMEKILTEERDGMSLPEILEWERLISENIKELRRWDTTIRAGERSEDNI